MNPEASICLGDKEQKGRRMIVKTGTEDKALRWLYTYMYSVAMLPGMSDSAARALSRQIVERVKQPGWSVAFPLR